MPPSLLSSCSTSARRQGFTAWQFGNNLGLWWAFWPDCFHKMMRRQAGAWARHTPPRTTLRLLMKLFRSSRAPYNTSKFGGQMKAARERMLSAFQAQPDNELLAMLLPSIAQDLNMDAASMSPFVAIRHLESTASRIHLKSDEAKDVRWMSWFDHAEMWSQEWHVEWATTLFQMWEEGQNPFSFMRGGAETDHQHQESYSVRTLRWQDSPLASRQLAILESRSWE